MRRTAGAASSAAFSCVLGLFLVLAAFPTSAGTLEAPSQEASQALFSEADVAFKRGDFDEAIYKYEGSYHALPESDRGSYLASLTIRNAMQAYDRRIDEEQDPWTRRQLLQRQGKLLEELLVAVATREGAAEELGSDAIAELEGIRRTIDEAIDAVEDLREPPTERDPEEPTLSLPTEPEEAEPGPAIVPKIPTSTPNVSHPRDRLGIGLTTGGGLMTGIGIGVSVGYFTIRREARILVDAAGSNYAPGSQPRADYLAGEDRRARKFMIAGSVVAGIGVAIAVGGVARLIAHRRRVTARSTARRGIPSVGPALDGVSYHFRF